MPTLITRLCTERTWVVTLIRCRRWHVRLSRWRRGLVVRRWSTVDRSPVLQDNLSPHRQQRRYLRSLPTLKRRPLLSRYLPPSFRRLPNRCLASRWLCPLCLSVRRTVSRSLRRPRCRPCSWGLRHRRWTVGVTSPWRQRRQVRAERRRGVVDRRPSSYSRYRWYFSCLNIC